VALELSGPKTTKTEEDESKEFEERMKMLIEERM
tara:strand:+ start:417 stop:518 length:102 start_codon:yes stop_codon:yes gene_type:complete